MEGAGCESDGGVDERWGYACLSTGSIFQLDLHAEVDFTGIISQSIKSTEASRRYQSQPNITTVIV